MHHEKGAKMYERRSNCNLSHVYTFYVPLYLFYSHREKFVMESLMKNLNSILFSISKFTSPMLHVQNFLYTLNFKILPLYFLTVELIVYMWINYYTKSFTHQVCVCALNENLSELLMKSSWTYSIGLQNTLVC